MGQVSAGMRRDLPTYVHRFRDRHGKMRHYFRRPNYPNVALPGLPGSREFREAYEAALEGRPLPIGADRTTPGSINALVIAYYRTAEFQQLATVTQATYRNLLERLRGVAGDDLVSQLRREHVRSLVATKAETPAAANATLKMLRILMRIAVDDGWRKDDPTIGVRRLRAASEGHHTWSEEEIGAYEAYWEAGTRQRLAMGLLLFTGQRRGDVIRLGRQHVRGDGIMLTQRKTGARLTVPVHPELGRLLESAPADQMTFLLTGDGKPFTDGGFGNWFRQACDEAGLPERCTAHGLRKASARRLAEAGCTAHQIMAVHGWTSIKEAERYTRAVDQEKLARSAIAAIPLKRDEK